MKHKGVTLIEVLIASLIFFLVMEMIFSSMASMKNGIIRGREQAEATMFLDSLELQLIRTFSMANTIMATASTDPLVLTNKGYLLNNSNLQLPDNFVRGFASYGPFGGDIYNSTKYGRILILMVGEFENPFLDRPNLVTDFYRAFGISHVEGNGPYTITEDSNFVYIERQVSGGSDIIRKMATKTQKLYIRSITIQKVSNRLYNISVGVRVYLHKSKWWEDSRSHLDPYNYGITRVISLYLRAR